MQNTQTTETRGVNAFTRKIEVEPGGRCIDEADFVQTTLKAGTPVGEDVNGLAHVVKVAEMQATANNSATAYRVLKVHNFLVGDHIMSAEGAKAQTITDITTTETDYDTLTVGTSIGTEVLKGTHLYGALDANQSTGSAIKYAPLGLVGEDSTLVASGNNLISVVLRGSAIEASIPPIGTLVKAKLPLIRFV
jgi:hypothetical protein